ncbi:copper resistance CopC family protein [Marinicella gelatinilytica]|uniref:copper resistance CopC family protein n=1 Tax=Marinicella gelatinilytica TaxID=2996017 RepID=UPI00226097F6|nr:copper resistance CopC family protein [Marinicella gelatinilytica]MCX7543869.1 copper resistance protein CopC [Marinicella gelatinilytica]
MNIKTLVTISLLLFSTLNWAHSDLDVSIPEAGETMNTPPDEIVLIYTEPVKLVKFELINADNQAVDTGFKPSFEDHAEFVIKVNDLDNGLYTVLWTIMGGDGHKGEGDFTFTLKQSKPDKHANHHSN